MAELKPCPFCGSMPKSGVEFYESYGAEVKLAAVVECTGCGIRQRKVFKAAENVVFVPFENYNSAFAEVVETWNRRAKDD